MANANVSDWENNPVIRKWKDGVASRGGRTLSTGYPYEPDKGAPVALWPDATKPGGRRYELAPYAVRLAVGFERTKDSATIAAGAAAENLEKAAVAAGLDKGVFGFVGKVLGLPRGAVVAVTISAALLGGYLVLASAGLVPSPTNRK